MAGGRISLLTEDTTLHIDELTFLVPSRSFFIEGSLLKAGYVSLATEFALRLLRDIGELPSAEIGAFFGFSDRETSVLVQELLLDGYVTFAGDRLKLARRGEDAFNRETGELQILAVEPFSDNFTIDLISLAPVENCGRVRMPWLTEIDIPDKARAAAARNAAIDGFRSNFGEWRDRRFRGGSGNGVRLQTIDEITPLGRSPVPITVPMTYAPSVSDLIEADFSNLRGRGRRGSRESLVNALSNEIRKIAAPGDHAAAVELTAEWDHCILKLAMASPAGLLTWIQQANRSDARLGDEIEPSVRLAGSMMLTDNIAKLNDFFEATLQSEFEPTPIYWLPAEHLAWGANYAITDVVRQLNDEAGKQNSIILFPRAEATERSHRDLKRQYGETHLFGGCVTLPANFLPLSLELLVQPNRWAIVLVHVPAPKTAYPVAIGYASTQPRVVKAVASLLGDVLARVNETHVAWGPSGKAPLAVLEAIDHDLSTS